MILYNLIFLLLLGIAFISLFVEVNRVYSFFILVTLILFGSLRYKVGMDYESYESIFDSIDNKPMSMSDAASFYLEPGYVMIISCLKYIGFDNIGLFALQMILSVYFVNKAIMKYSQNIFVAWVIVYGVYYVNLFFNGIRQGLFIAIIMYIFPYLLEKSRKNFLNIVILSIVLGFFLHKTAVILPLIYIVCLFTPSLRNKYIILLGTLVWAFTGVGNMLMQVGGLAFFKDNAYLGVVDLYSTSEAFGKEINFFSISVLHRLAILVVALYFSSFASADPLFKKLTNIYFWGAVAYFALVPLGYIMATRVSMNLKIFDVLLIPYFLVFLKEYSFKIIGLLLISLWSFAVMLTNFYLPGNYEYYIPYRTIFSK